MFRHLVLFLILAFPAMSAERVALVVGMADYAHISPLRNTANDARAISATLDRIGFDVTTLIDADGAAVRQALEDLSFKAETADLALIYFAGHGVEVQGENFLIPVDAKVASNRDIQRQSLSLEQFLGAVDRARKMRVVILDSCRDNPFQDDIEIVAATTGSDPANSRGGSGLAEPSPDRGTLVAFAAKDGAVALDGDGENSPYAQALVSRLAEPNLEISLMFRQIRDDVLKSTGNRQEPHTYGALSGVPFYFAEVGAEARAIEAEDRRIAWSALRSDQVDQLTLLAGQGDTRAMLGLAYMHLNPDGGVFNVAKAAGLLKRAVERSAPEAQFELAKLYEQGIGVEQNNDVALRLYRAAADQGFSDAINDLGFLYFNGGLGLETDQAQAIAHFTRAADLRHPEAMFNVAALIDDGLIGGKSHEDAADYLYRSLRAGSEDVLRVLTNEPNMFKLETRQALQSVLSQNEFYEGATDGILGQGSIRGIRRAFGLTN